MTSTTENRIKQTFLLLDHATLHYKEVTALYCYETENFWYVPDDRTSYCVGVHLFNNKQDLKAKAVELFKQHEERFKRIEDAFRSI